MLTKVERMRIAADVVKTLGMYRAAEASVEPVTPEPPKFGFVGVDKPYKDSSVLRARIRVCDALTGKDVRVTLCRSRSAEECGYAYAVAHTQLWGSFSFVGGDFNAEEIAEMVRMAKDGQNGI